MDNCIRVYRDGTSWCAVLPDFINLAESNAWFGNTPQEALESLMVSNNHTLDYYF